MKVILSLLISLFLSGHMLAQVDSGYVDIKGGQLFYQTFGEGEPLLVICGGGSMGSKGYKVFGTELSINRMVILFDSRGIGRSVSKIENRYTRDGRAVLELEDIEALRKHLKIKKWDILGQTFGAKTAMEYIYKHPDQVNRFVISSAFGFGLNDKSSTQERKMVSDDKYASIIAMVKDELMVESKKEDLLKVD